MKIKFDDNDQFGDLSFLDILEDNDIPFIYNGQELIFLNNVSQVYATHLWQGLTGKLNLRNDSK